MSVDVQEVSICDNCVDEFRFGIHRDVRQKVLIGLNVHRGHTGKRCQLGTFKCGISHRGQADDGRDTIT